MGSFTKPIPPGTIDGEQIADNSVTGQQVDESTLSGVPVEEHTTSHQKEGGDGVPVESLPTSENDSSKVLKPDGSGGVGWQTDETGNDEKVKASSDDPTADYLDGKTDGTTIRVGASEKLEVIDSPKLEGNDTAAVRNHSPASHGNEAHSLTFITSAGVTKEALGTNGDIGPGSDQVPQGDHDHDGTDSPKVKGTNIASTGESGGTKFLREDGDGTSSWQNATDENAIHGNVAAEINAIAGKTTPVDADALLIEDSADGTPYAKKKLTWAALKATIKAYLDTTIVVRNQTISPAALTGNVNDWNPSGLATTQVIRVDPGGANREITGIVAQGSGRVIYLLNIGTNDIKLKNENASSVAANRFCLKADLTLEECESVILLYDGTTSRWRVVGANI